MISGTTPKQITKPANITKNPAPDHRTGVHPRGAKGASLVWWEAEAERPSQLGTVCPVLYGQTWTFFLFIDRRENECGMSATRARLTLSKVHVGRGGVSIFVKMLLRRYME